MMSKPEEDGYPENTKNVVDSNGGPVSTIYLNIVEGDIERSRLGHMTYIQ